MASGTDFHVAHRHHLFQPCDRVAWCVGMQRRHGAFVTRIHGLEHVKGLLTADLAEDDPVRPHPQGVFDKLTLTDFALAFNIGRAGFHTRNMRLL